MKSYLRYVLSRIIKFRSLAGEKGTFRFAHGIAQVDRIALVNHLITTKKYKSYLEIGVRNKTDMHDLILANRRSSVDPDPNAEAEYCMTSDEYFHSYNEKFDIIFIDGLHEGEQVRADIHNSLLALNDGGTILLHDLNPPTAFHARKNFEVNGQFPAWNGSSWEGYAWYRRHGKNLSMCVVDTDWGVGIIHQGAQKIWDGPISGYSNLEKDRKRLLNLISVKDFLKKYS
jgi:hypothetical protein